MRVSTLALTIGLPLAGAVGWWFRGGAPVRPGSVRADERESPGCSNARPAWIWCDDFESDHVRRYFEFVNTSTSMSRQAGAGRNGSVGLRVRWQKGQVDAGSLKLAFGRTPLPYMRPVDEGTDDYRELYWRIYVRSQTGWEPNGNDKFTRASVMAGPSWQQAAVLHVWGGSARNGEAGYVLDPVSGVSNGRLVTTTYNDMGHFRWLGAAAGRARVFGREAGAWHCVEAHMRLNEPGQSDGLAELWIDGLLDARRSGLDYVGDFSAYGINALYLENYINDGAPQTQTRDYDDLVVSTERIGCA